MVLKSPLAAGTNRAHRKKKEEKERSCGAYCQGSLQEQGGDKGDPAQGAVANLSVISVGPLPLKEVGQPPPTHSASPHCQPTPQLSPFSSRFSLEPVVSKHWRVGTAVPLCHGFLCGSVHTNGMPEWQNLTLILQNVLRSWCFPNWLSLHITLCSFTQRCGAPAGSSFCCFCCLSEGLREERKRDMY